MATINAGIVDYIRYLTIISTQIFEFVWDIHIPVHVSSKKCSYDRSKDLHCFLMKTVIKMFFTSETPTQKKQANVTSVYTKIRYKL